VFRWLLIALLFLLPYSAWSGQSFDGTDDEIDWGDIPLIDDATSVSLSTWVQLNALTQDGHIFGQWAGVNTAGILLFFDDVGSSTTDTFKVLAEENSGGDFAAMEGATKGTTGSWQHVYASFIAGNEIQLWVDGVEDANSPAAITLVGDLGTDGASFRMGENATGGRDLDGHLGEITVWAGVILTDAEIVSLSKGISPWLVHPKDIVFHAPLHGLSTPDVDFAGRAAGTITGATKSALHPPMIYPGMPFILGVPVATAGTTATWPSSSWDSITQDGTPSWGATPWP